MIDPSIALQVKAPNVDSPVDQYGKMLSLQNLVQQQKLQGAQLQAATLENQQRQYEVGATQATNDAFRAAVTKDPDTGLPKFNRSAVTDYLSKQGYGAKIPGIMKGFLEMDQTAENLRKTQGENGLAEADYAGDIGAAAKKAGYDPGVLALGLQHAMALYPQTAGPALASLQSDPGQARTIADHLIAGSPKQRELAAKEQTSQAEATRAEASAGELNLRTYQQSLQNYAKTGSLAGSQQAYSNWLKQVPPDYQKWFPESYDPQQVLAVGSTPGEVLTAGLTSKRDAESARHNKADEATARLNAGTNSKRLTLEFMQAGFGADGKQSGANPLADSIYAGKINPETARDYIRRQPGLLQQIVAAHPDFDEATLDRRFAFNKRLTDYNPSEIGGQALALNKLVHHADLLYDMIDNLQNGSFSPKNKLYNSVATTFGKAPEGDFNTVRDFVMHEAGKLAQGGAPNESDIKAEVENFSSAKDPAALKSHLQRVLQIAGGGMNALNEQGRMSGMGQDFTVLGPEGAAVMQKRGFDPATLKPAQKGAAPAAAAAPAEHGRQQLPPVGPGRVRLQAPDGSISDVLPSAVDHYLRKGAKRL